MNVNRYGRAKILTQQEIQLVFAQGFDSERDKTLFGVCLFTAARIREACTNHFSRLVLQPTILFMALGTLK
ncbi:hypothetical protein [Brasilonema octagenarum]|jgi:integrase/recombinase XerD|uniref:hypothetical protein n=1 Tax=Brasilonema octagenarum TaxID=417105 RepID=UPI002006EC73|nr:hypothetical protein [Brasilonema octagenarum]